MNLQELIQRVRNSLNPQELHPNDAVILGFLRMLEETKDEELSCDEIYKKLDEYVELEVDRKDAAQLMPLIREHLDACSNCCEEYETLLSVIVKMDKT